MNISKKLLEELEILTLDIGDYILLNAYKNNNQEIVEFYSNFKNIRISLILQKLIRLGYLKIDNSDKEDIFSLTLQGDELIERLSKL